MSADETGTSLPEIIEGGDSHQRKAEPEESRALVPVSSGGLTQLTLTDSLRDLAQIKGEAAMSLLCIHASRLETEVRDLKTENEQSLTRANDWMKSYYEEKQNHALAAQQLRGVSQVKNIQKYVGALGGVAAGVAIPFLVTGPIGWGLAGTMFGLFLLAAGFWPSDIRKGKQ
jgi:hypothetical protein